MGKIMTIAALIARLSRQTGNGTPDSDLTQIFLDCINEALGMFPLFTQSRLILTTSSGTLSALDRAVDLPTNFISEREVYILESGNRKRITKRDGKAFNDLVNESEAGTLSYYRTINNYIEFDRPTNADVVIYIEHFKDVDDVTTADTFFGDSAMLNVLSNLTKALYYSDYEEDAVKGREKLAIGKAGLDKLSARHLREELPENVEEADEE